MMTDSLTITIIVIILIAIIGAFLKGRIKDKCLLSYANDLVTFLKTDGKVIWGRLHVESTGLEFRYQKEHMDADGHIETSFILYRHEFPSIQAILRFHDELDEQCQKDRKKELEKVYHPTLLRRMNRKIVNFFKTIRDSVLEVVNLMMDQAKKGVQQELFYLLKINIFHGLKQKWSRPFQRPLNHFMKSTLEQRLYWK